MTLHKTQLGISFGLIAGVIDVIPMLIQKLTWNANLSAFTFWIIAGFFIATTQINLKGIIKGMIISILLLIPLSFIIGWQEPISLVPITVMNLILGGALGFFIEKYGE